MSQALTDINRMSADYDIYFIYDELEKFPVTCQFHRLPVIEAIKKVIGFYPIEMTISDKRIYLECVQKKNAVIRGRVVGRGMKPVPFASVILSNPNTGEKLNTGVSNQNGDFSVPCDSMAVSVKISCIGYNTFKGVFNTGDIGSVRILPVVYDLSPVEVARKRKGKQLLSKSYHRRAKKVRAEVWGKADSCFETTTVPDSLLTFSEIIIAHSHEQKYRRRFLFRPWNLFAARHLNSMGTYRITSTSVDRQRVFVNDEHAASKYSSLEYPWVTIMSKDPNKNIFMGIRVIKPNGRVYDIETDEYTQPVADKEPPRPDRIMVDGLEKGDIIDYFVWTEASISDNNPEPAFVIVDHDCPQMTNKLSFDIDKHLNVQYRLVNEADTLDMVQDNAGNTILNAHYKNLMPKFHDERRYVVYVRDEDMKVNAPLSATGNAVKVNPDIHDILNTRMEIYKNMEDMSDKKVWEVRSWNATDTTVVGALVANLSQKTSSQELLAEALYRQALRFPSSLVDKNHFHDGCESDIFLNREYTIMFAHMLHQAAIPFQIAMTTMKDKEGIDLLMDENNIVWMILTDDGKFFIPVLDGNYPSDDYADVNGMSSQLLGQKAKFMGGNETFIISDDHYWK